jgi:mannosyltransferase
VIEIDGIIFSLQRHGGVSVYSRQIVGGIARSGTPGLLTLVSPNHFGKEVLLQGSIVRRALPARLLERYRSWTPDPKARVAHSTYYRVPRDPRVPLVTTVYDFVYERYWRGPPLWIHHQQKRRAILRSAAVICISESTRDDLLRFVPEVDPGRVRVVHLGAGDAFAPEVVPEREAPFVLFVGKRESYKNFRLVLAAMEKLEGWEVRCVGGEAQGDRDFRELPEWARSRVKLLGVVDDEALNRLYNQAACLAYTSEYEGFGIPVLEALKAGCPVVTSGCASVMEIAAGACLTVPAGDPRALARACKEVLRPGVRGELREAGLMAARAFSWDRCVRETAEVYDDVARATSRISDA